MANEQDKTKVLYDAVSKDYNIGTFDEFKSKLQDENKRKAFYNGVGKEYNLGTYDEFSSKVSPVKKKNLHNRVQALWNLHDSYKRNLRVRLRYHTDQAQKKGLMFKRS